MNSGKKILILTIVAVLLAILFWPRKSLKLANVIDGNTIVLNNGAQVKLLGISSTVEGQASLEELVGEKVELVADNGNLFETSNLSASSVVWAYVLLPDRDYDCINSSLLRQGKVLLVENCNDSLKAYREYADNIIKRDDNQPEPTPTPPQVIAYDDDGIKLPAYQISGERKHSAWYSDGNMNLEMLDEACDYNCPYTKCFANQLAARSKGSFNPGQICEVFKYCYNKWSYVNDPKGNEYLARASESIASYLSGDCDDFAILIATCMLAIGADVCVTCGQGPEGGHAFAEVDVTDFSESDLLDTIQNHFDGNKISKIHTRRANGRVWLNLDWWAAYPGGPYFDCSYSYDTFPCIDGKWSWSKVK